MGQNYILSTYDLKSGSGGRWKYFAASFPHKLSQSFIEAHAFSVNSNVESFPA